MIARGLRWVAWSILAAAIAFGVSFAIPARFNSYATLYFPLAQSRSISALAGLAGEPAPGGAVSNFGGALVSPVVGGAPQTAMGILESYACREKVVERAGLESTWGLSKPQAVEKLAERTSVGLDRHGFVRIEMSLESAATAATIVSAYLEVLAETGDRLSLNVSQKNREFIEQKVVAERRAVETLEKQLVQDLAQLSTGGIEGLSELYIQTRGKLADAEVGAAAARTQMREVDTTLQKLYAQARRDPAALSMIEDLGGQIKLRRLALEDAEAKFVRTSAEVKTQKETVQSAERVAQSLVESKENARQAGTAAEIAALRADWKRLETQASGYAERLRALGERLRREPEKQVAVESLQRQLQMKSANLAKLEAELQLAMIAESRDPSQFEVVDSPRPADRSSYPRRILWAVVAWVGAFLLQAGFAAVKSDRGA